MYRPLFIAVLFGFTLIVAVDAQDGPKDSVVLIIRHAEDGASDRGLTLEGQKRADAYRDYFKNFTVDSKQLRPDVVFAAKDSKKSQRPRLTVEPFAKAEQLRIDTRFGNDQSAELAADLRATEQKKVILVCWRHPYMPNLLHALGANPEDLLPNGKWPAHVFDWVILLRFDQNGRLIPGSPRRIQEHLMPDDSH